MIEEVNRNNMSDITVENISSEKKGNTYFTHWKMHKKVPMQFTLVDEESIKSMYSKGGGKGTSNTAGDMSGGNNNISAKVQSNGLIAANVNPVDMSKRSTAQRRKSMSNEDANGVTSAGNTSSSGSSNVANNRQQQPTFQDQTFIFNIQKQSVGTVKSRSPAQISPSATVFNFHQYSPRAAGQRRFSAPPSQLASDLKSMPSPAPIQQQQNTSQKIGFIPAQHTMASVQASKQQDQVSFAQPRANISRKRSIHDVNQLEELKQEQPKREQKQLHEEQRYPQEANQNSEEPHYQWYYNSLNTNLSYEQQQQQQQQQRLYPDKNALSGQDYISSLTPEQQFYVRNRRSRSVPAYQFIQQKQPQQQQQPVIVLPRISEIHTNEYSRRGSIDELSNNFSSNCNTNFTYAASSSSSNSNLNNYNLSINANSNNNTNLETIVRQDDERRIRRRVSYIEAMDTKELRKEWQMREGIRRDSIADISSPLTPSLQSYSFPQKNSSITIPSYGSDNIILPPIRNLDN
jgi:hypothetical protein